MFSSPELRRMTPAPPSHALRAAPGDFSVGHRRPAATDASLYRNEAAAGHGRRARRSVAEHAGRGRDGRKEPLGRLRSTLEEAVPELRALQEDYEIKVYEFDAEIIAGRVSQTDKFRLVRKGGRKTVGHWRGARRRAPPRGRQAAGRGDSGQRRRPAGVYAARPAAADRRHADWPIWARRLYTVAFGRERSASQSRDVAITDLLVNPTVYVKNELAIAGTLRVDGLANQDIPVQVLFETAPGKMEVVATLRPRATEDAQLLPLNADLHSRDAQASDKLTAPRRSAGRRERAGHDQQRALHVCHRARWRLARAVSRRPPARGDGVSAALARCIGRYSGRCQALRSALGRDKDGRSIWQEPEETSSRAQYDVYIIGDLDSKAFRTRQRSGKHLSATVDRGAGLIMLGGYHSFWPGGYQSNAARDILPIEAGDLDRLVRQRFGEPPMKDPNIHLAGPVKMLPDERFADVSFMQLAPPSRESRCLEEAAAAQRGQPLSRAKERRQVAGGDRRRQDDSWPRSSRAAAACWPSRATRPISGGYMASTRSTSASGDKSSSGLRTSTKPAPATSGYASSSGASTPVSASSSPPA